MMQYTHGVTVCDRAGKECTSGSLGAATRAQRGRARNRGSAVVAAMVAVEQKLEQQAPHPASMASGG